MKKNDFILFCLVISLIAVTACSGGQSSNPQQPAQDTPSNQSVATQPAAHQPQTTSGNEVSFQKDVLPIFQQFGGNHHGNDSVLSLETYEGVMKDVKPGDPEGSKLWQRLNGQGGPVMPPNGPLSTDLLKVIYDWIKQGAKNN
jgi:hypothetical protein